MDTYYDESSKSLIEWEGPGWYLGSSGLPGDGPSYFCVAQSRAELIERGLLANPGLVFWDQPPGNYLCQ